MKLKNNLPEQFYRSSRSFRIVDAIEGAVILRNAEKLVRLSKQGLIDCTWECANNGRDGGKNFRAYQWMMLAEVFQLKRNTVPTLIQMV